VAHLAQRGGLGVAMLTLFLVHNTLSDWLALKGTSSRFGGGAWALPPRGRSLKFRQRKRTRGDGR
jgi:hypothetical protein